MSVQSELKPLMHSSDVKAFNYLCTGEKIDV